MFILGIETATPPHRYSQKECWTILNASARFQEFTPRSQAILKKVLTCGKRIDTRHLALDDLNQAFEITPDVLHARFLAHAPRFARRRQTLARGGRDRPGRG
jgi:predicted naringenin-chalcone synthase